MKSPFELLGIPDNSSSYIILGVNHSNSLKEIKKAYRTLSLKWHPDKNSLNTDLSKEEVEEVFKLINNAVQDIEHSFVNAAQSSAQSSTTPKQDFHTYESKEEYKPKKPNPIYNGIIQLLNSINFATDANKAHLKTMPEHYLKNIFNLLNALIPHHVNAIDENTISLILKESNWKLPQTFYIVLHLNMVKNISIDSSLLTKIMQNNASSGYLLNILDTLKEHSLLTDERIQVLMQLNDHQLYSTSNMIDLLADYKLINEELVALVVTKVTDYKHFDHILNSIKNIDNSLITEHIIKNVLNTQSAEDLHCVVNHLGPLSKIKPELIIGDVLNSIFSFPKYKEIYNLLSCLELNKNIQISKISSPQFMLLIQYPQTATFIEGLRNNYLMLDTPDSLIELIINNANKIDKISTIANTLFKDFYPVNQKSLEKIISDLNSNGNLEDSSVVDNAKTFLNNDTIEEIKNNLKLDINNQDHLAYWNNHTTRFFNIGGIKVSHEGVDYHVPTRVYQMMKISTQTHENQVDYVNKLDAARSHRPGFWNNPLSFFTRQAATSALYEEKDLSTYKAK